MIRERSRRRSDCWVSPQLIETRTGQRGAALAGLQLHCRVGSHEIEMLAQTEDAVLKLIGMATIGGEPAAHVEFELFDADSGRIEQTIETSIFGEFDIAAPAPGRWALRVGDDPYAPSIRLWEVLR